MVDDVLQTSREVELDSANWRLPSKRESARRLRTSRRSSKDAWRGSGQSPATGLTVVGARVLVQSSKRRRKRERGRGARASLWRQRGSYSRWRAAALIVAQASEEAPPRRCFRDEGRG
jgi:hypothetical protein